MAERSIDELATPKQRGYLTALYRQRRIFRDVPLYKDECSREIERLAPKKKQTYFPGAFNRG